MSITKKRIPDPASIRSICVIQLEPFGDVFLSTAHLETIRRWYPDATLTFVVKEPYQKVIEGHPAISSIMLIRNRKGWRYAVERVRAWFAMEKAGFDMVIDQQLMNSSQMLTLFSRARWRVGYFHTGMTRMDWVYNVRASFGPVRYAAMQKYDILKPLGIPDEKPSLQLALSPKDREYVRRWITEAGIDIGKTLVVSPGSALEKRRYPAEGFQQAADHCHKKFGMTILFLWGPGEEHSVEAVRRAMHSPALVAPPTTIKQAVVLLEKCGLFLCNEGGMSHFSVVAGCKTLAVFGPIDPNHWSPASVFATHRHLHNPEAVPGDRFFGITPEQLIAELDDMLSHK
ncbi:MAG: glycosyltransferase family 9 protein [Chitinispirillaceae bacterium]|jgi:ADP-heptose:LPS heptosyltransferase|nr:glycosyltransferase family 9 protein [Chitinispirillaceae bacterium]